MPKKIIINEHILRALVKEMASDKRVLNEISAADAYNRFYKDKMGEDVFRTAMMGTPTMSPFHKLLLSLIVKAGNEEQQMTLAEYASDIWTNARPETRQNIINAVKEGDINEQNFMEGLKEISTRKYQTEGEMAQGGLIIIRDDENLKITCTTNYTSSRKYYGHTQWCTASGIDGEYNGFFAFKSYTMGEDGPGCLIQYTRKNDGACVQCLYKMTGRKDTMDINDSEMDVEMFDKFLVSCGVPFNDLYKYDSYLDTFSNLDLIRKTGEAVEAEAPYWERKTKKLLDKASANIAAKTWNDKEWMNKALYCCYAKLFALPMSPEEDTFSRRGMKAMGVRNEKVKYYIVRLRLTGDMVKGDDYDILYGAYIFDAMGREAFSKTMRKNILVTRGKNTFIPVMDLGHSSFAEIIGYGQMGIYAVGTGRESNTYTLISPYTGMVILDDVDRTVETIAPYYLFRTKEDYDNESNSVHVVNMANGQYIGKFEYHYPYFKLPDGQFVNAKEYLGSL